MGTSKLSERAEARRMAYVFRAGFLEEVALEPALRDCQAELWPRTVWAEGTA